MGRITFNLKEMRITHYLFRLFILVSLVISACSPRTTNPAPPPNTTVLVTTSNASLNMTESEKQSAGFQFVRDILNIAQANTIKTNSSWLPPIPPTNGQAPRILTEEEKQRIVAIANTSPEVVAAKQNKDIVSVNTSYLWIGWIGHADGESYLNYDPIEKGIVNLTDKGDTWYPAADFLFHSIYGDYGVAGIHVAVNLVTGKAVYLSGYRSSALPARTPPPVSPAPVVASRPEIPVGTPVISMQIRALMGGTFEKLDIYDDGTVLDVKDTNLRMSPPEGPTRVWRKGLIQAEELNGLIRLFQSSEFASLNSSYVFPGEPTAPLQGPPLNGRVFGDAGYGFTINSTGLQKTVGTFGYLAPGDMPYPLGELYTKLRAVVDEKTSEVYREHIQ